MPVADKNGTDIITKIVPIRPSLSLTGMCPATDYNFQRVFA